MERRDTTRGWESKKNDKSKLRRERGIRSVKRMKGSKEEEGARRVQCGSRL